MQTNKKLAGLTYLDQPQENVFQCFDACIDDPKCFAIETSFIENKKKINCVLKNDSSFSETEEDSSKANFILTNYRMLSLL